ncbi:MAG: hypothetical protein M3072_06130 [Candidatus Dormibacteraeota bacterium]|nr:hypothetical protein [Candidatus Dormibacteraeota bacterium]
MNWQLILAYISPITSAALVVVGVVYGQLIANAKNAQIEQLREQLKTHELFEVRGVRERIEAIHAEYGERIDDLKRQLETAQALDEQRLAAVERQADTLAGAFAALVAQKDADAAADAIARVPFGEEEGDRASVDEERRSP